MLTHVQVASSKMVTSARKPMATVTSSVVTVRTFTTPRRRMIRTTTPKPKPKGTEKYGPIRYVGVSHRDIHHC